MQVGIPKEIKTHEDRVGATPDGVRELVVHGHQVLVDQNAAAAIGLSDARYLATDTELADAPLEVDATLLRDNRPLRPRVDLDSIDCLNSLIGLSQRLKVVIAESDYPDLVTLKDLLADLRARLRRSPQADPSSRRAGR